MTGRIMIIDDSDFNVRDLMEVLQGEYDLESAISGMDALEKLPRFSPDLVLLDLMMPGLDGYEVCRRIKSDPLGRFTQVILLIGDATTERRLQAYEAGADDFLAKPIDHNELLAKVRAHLRMRETARKRWGPTSRGFDVAFTIELERLVEQRTNEVIATRDIAVFALAKLAESRDPETGEHLERMRTYSRMLAEYLAENGPYQDRIDDELIKNIYRTAPLHDIGKVGIPDAILLKPARLTIEEFDIMKQHAVIGSDALEHAVRQNPSGTFLSMAQQIARHHHEWFDGGGYPDGLAGEDIPLPARIVGLADVYDALTSVRVYKPAFAPERAKAMIEELDGRQFDPAVVEAFRACFEQFVEFGAKTRDREKQLLLADVAVME